MVKYAAIGLVLILPILAVAQTGPALLLEPLLSEEEVWESRGDALFLNNGSTSNKQDFQMSVFEVSGRFREQRERLVPRIGWDLTYLDLDSNEPLLKQDLIDVSLAAGVELGRYFDWRSGLTVGVGYAGNSPFGETDAWYGKATLLFGKAWNKNTDVALVVDYDGNRSVYPDIPLPGFAIRHQFDPQLSWVVGVPLSSVTWKPIEFVTVDITWTLLDRFDAKVEYEMAPQWTIFGNLEDRREVFTIDGLSGHDRLLFHQRRAELGVRWQPWDHTSLQLAGGYAFGGEFSTGWDSSDSDLVADLSDEPYVRIGFERQF